jgi:hypothetical protein
MRIIIEQAGYNSLTIEGDDNELLELLNISALARKQNLPTEVVKKRINRKWPLVLSLITEPRSYN